MKISPKPRMIATIGCLLFIFTLLLLPATHCSNKTILIDNFAGPLSAKWQTKSFKGETKYQIKNVDQRSSLEATSHNSASGLFYKIDYDPINYPFITWNWRIKEIITTGDARTKQGDDYSARIYVVFPGFFFWQTKALNYIWANKLPQDEFIKNSHTSNAVMIAIQSGNNKAGQWLQETRNIVEDYKKAFGEAPPRVGSIAIMTDTDNTGEITKAWYGPIKISSEIPPN